MRHQNYNRTWSNDPTTRTHSGLAATFSVAVIWSFGLSGRVPNSFSLCLLDIAHSTHYRNHFIFLQKKIKCEKNPWKRECCLTLSSALRVFPTFKAFRTRVRGNVQSRSRTSNFWLNILWEIETVKKNVSFILRIAKICKFVFSYIQICSRTFM